MRDCQNRSALHLALFSFYQVRLELASPWCSDDYAFTLEGNLDTFAVRRSHLFNFVKDRSFVLGAIRLIGYSQRNIEHVVVNLWIAAHKILVT